MMMMMMKMPGECMYLAIGGEGWEGREGPTLIRHAK
jgi:hypothetical protein